MSVGRIDVHSLSSARFQMELGGKLNSTERWVRDALEHRRPLIESSLSFRSGTIELRRIDCLIFLFAPSCNRTLTSTVIIDSPLMISVFLMYLLVRLDTRDFFTPLLCSCMFFSERHLRVGSFFFFLEFPLLHR